VNPNLEIRDAGRQKSLQDLKYPQRGQRSLQLRTSIEASQLGQVRSMASGANRGALVGPPRERFPGEVSPGASARRSTSEAKVALGLVVSPALEASAAVGRSGTAIAPTFRLGSIAGPELVPIGIPVGRV
jgi:hypothetical protein